MSSSEEQREKQLNIKLDYLSNTKTIIANALTQVGAEVTEDMTFRQYANLITTLGSGDVLLFSTVDEMEAYDKPKEGVLAVVYRETSSSILNTPARYVIFPEEATVSLEMTTSHTIDIYKLSDGTIIGSILLAPTEVIIQLFDGSVYVKYTSEDGINYIRETEIDNPVDMGSLISIPYYFIYSSYINEFMKIKSGIFDGLYCYTSGAFISVLNQFTVNATNQILTGYTAYGATGPITGDGTYITNIKTNEYINKYLPNIADIGTQNIIQNGTPVKSMTYIQREKLPISDAFEATFDVDDCIVQLADTYDITVDNGAYSTLIQNYLNCSKKFNYAFFIDDVAYRLYLGYNYNTTIIYNAEGEANTEPHQMTSLYGFIVNLENLSIYKTFQNNDSWAFTEKDFGNLLTYEYSIQSDCLVLLTDLDGWGYSDGAYMGITTIKAVTGARNTKYFKVSYEDDYTYKSITNTSYDYDQDCYYLVYHTFQKRSDGGRSSTKRVCKITPTGTLSSVFTSAETMSNITSLWSNYFKNVGSLFCYYTESKGMCLRNLTTGNEIRLYGTTFSNSQYFGVDANNVYISHKPNSTDEKYNIYRINKNTLEATIIPETESSSRLLNCFYTYNRELAIFYENKVISLQGDFLAWFMKAMLTNQSISGIDRLDEFGYKSSFMDYQLNITASKITAKVPKYTYYRYFDLDGFPASKDLCMTVGGNYKTSTGTNDNTTVLKCKSVILSENKADPEEIRKAIEATERILGNSDPSEVAKYIKNLQDTLDLAIEISNNIKGEVENN